MAQGNILHPWGVLWLTFVILFLVGVRYFSGEADAADWIQTAGFLVATLGGGPIAWAYAERRTRITASQTSNKTLMTAAKLLGHEMAAVRLGGLYALELIAQSSSPSERLQIMHLVANYIRAAGVAHVDDTMAIFQRALEEGPDSWERRSAAAEMVVLLLRAQELAKGKEDWGRLEKLRERVEKWGEPSPDGGREAVSSLMPEITELLLPNLPMPTDLDAAIAIIRSVLSQGDRVSFEGPGTSGRAAVLDLSNTCLYNADLRDTDLRHMDLSDSHLRGCVLCRADLSQALLASTILHDTDLRWATLVGAEFRGADLTGSNLCGADLRDAINITQEQLDEAKGDEMTRLPEGMQRPEHWL